MSNDGSNYKPWKVRKGVFKSSGTSEYTLPLRNTPSPIIEMPLSPPPVNIKILNSSSTAQCPQSAAQESCVTSSPTDKCIFSVREVPIEEVRNGNFVVENVLDYIDRKFLFTFRFTVKIYFFRKTTH